MRKYTSTFSFYSQVGILINSCVGTVSIKSVPNKIFFIQFIFMNNYTNLIILYYYLIINYTYKKLNPK